MRKNLVIHRSPFRILGRSPAGVTCSAATLLLAAALQAEDTIVVRAKEGRGTQRLTGEILDYTGSQLRYRRPGNREATIESSRVQAVETPRSESHRQGDQLLAEQQPAEALIRYQLALSEEKREWVRRQILSRIIRCLRETERVEGAIDLFLQLYRQDPQTLYFDAMPIPWLTESPSPALAEKARTLLQDPLPVARFMGASWLVPTEHREAALNVLQSLLTADDPRVAFWAEAQRWRTQTATVTAEGLARWRQHWERMPPELQPGPAYLLGQAYSRLGQPEEAALCYLRAPLLQPEDTRLAAQGLLAAGKEFETMKRLDEAATLYREVVTDYGSSAAAPIARQRWQAIAPGAIP